MAFSCTHSLVSVCIIHGGGGGGGFGGLSFVCLAGFGVVMLIFMKRNWDG